MRTICYQFVGSKPFFAGESGRDTNVLYPVALMDVMKIPAAAALALVLCTALLLPAAAQEPAHWEVKWYRVRATTDGGEFRVFLGSEQWNHTSFHFDWGSHRIYGTHTDNVVFVATTTIYSSGGSYRFKLYDVDDTATVTIDGEEILTASASNDVPGQKIVNYYLDRGSHLLRVEYREICCTASIGFDIPDELFEKDKSDAGDTPGFTGILAAAALLAVAPVAARARRP